MRDTPTADTEQTDQAGTQPPGPDSGASKGLTEARDRYRTERDTARDELAAAQARINALQRAEVERLAAGNLSHPADLFSLSGNELADYLTEAGGVDADKVVADVAAILAERPGLRKQVRGFDPSQGLGGTSPAEKQPTWSALLTG